MSPRSQPLLQSIGALALIVAGLLFLLNVSPQSSRPIAQSQSASIGETAAVGSQVASSSSLSPTAPTSTSENPPSRATPAKPAAERPASESGANGNEVSRIKNPYPFAPEPFAVVNDAARAALVNILCTPHAGSLRPISGSGVLIDPRGVILTNAHVAQYVLLSQSPQINLPCFVRTGSPATARWRPQILYIPPVWVEAHASEITAERPVGTGEHDYALLLITNSVDGSALPSTFPSLPIDTREAIGFEGDSILVASYPAEFLGGLTAQFNLYPVSSVTAIQKLLTFGTDTVDLLSLGGIIEAQSGSSGGAVVNAWGRLVGIITTTSGGTTTADRDLHALTLGYISRDLSAQTQFDLPTILGGDVAAEADDFSSHVSQNLIGLYLDQLSK